MGKGLHLTTPPPFLGHLRVELQTILGYVEVHAIMANKTGTRMLLFQMPMLYIIV